MVRAYNSTTMKLLIVLKAETSAVKGVARKHNMQSSTDGQNNQAKLEAKVSTETDKDSEVE
ncbi:hypothetical protein P3T76_000135 [Phytophthora citrophthora]|uniref:Uncharacterized protein n=1 Tax=Phytophthora citrophthora TaxID=4793 RepID=A0AAD9GZC3_9STRA|nr:hypothetical protein P3T76_000135 [Phytophthora citrophthora]